MNSRRPRRRPSRVLIQYILVIAIIAVLMGLYLPAVIAAFRAGRRFRNANNIEHNTPAGRAFQGSPTPLRGPLARIPASRKAQAVSRK